MSVLLALILFKQSSESVDKHVSVALGLVITSKKTPFYDASCMANSVKRREQKERKKSEGKRRRSFLHVSRNQAVQFPGAKGAPPPG